MNLLLLNQNWTGAVKPWWPMTPLPAGLPGLFASNPVGVCPPVVPSAVPGSFYAQVPVARASFLWDAVVVGYGSLAELALLAATPAELARVRAIASWRSHSLRLSYRFPNGLAWGPVLRDEYALIEQSEKRVISFFLGQAMAQRAARLVWPVHRLYHRSLYSPHALALAGIPLPPGQSPDYFAAIRIGGVPLAIAVVEAKGRVERFNPATNSGHRAELDRAFQQLPAIGVVPHHYAVSVACLDALIEGVEPGCIVGQFWDPPTERPWQLPPGFVQALDAAYFARLYALLQCLGPSRIELIGATPMVVWTETGAGIAIGVHVDYWEQLQDGHIPLHPGNEESLVDHAFEVRNADGLFLRLDD